MRNATGSPEDTTSPPVRPPTAGVHGLAFDPPWPLRGRHVQTCVSTAFRRIEAPRADERWRIPVDDGIALVGEFSRGPSDAAPDALAILMHGLGGSAHSKYVLGTAHRLLRGGLGVLRMNLRGVEIDGQATDGLYHSGLTADLTRVVDHARTRGFERFFIAGFSLSANVLLKWLGEAERPGVTGFAVSPPVRLSRSSMLIDAPQNWIYRQYFLRRLHATIEAKARAFPASFGRFARKRPPRSMRAFDDTITAPYHGFRDADDYYARASSVDVLANIRNPVTIVHAMDDPLVDGEDLQLLIDRRPPSMDIALPARGGHVGFYEGPSAGYAAERWIAEAFARAL